VGIFAMSAKMKMDVNKFFEVYLLNRPLLSTKDQFVKKLFGQIKLQNLSWK
jgi:hypothetical protein